MAEHRDATPEPDSLETDSPFKKPAPRSQRKACGRKPGGQQGHPGTTLALVEAPDERIVVALTGICDCGRCLGEIAAEVQPERRQVVELEIQRKVIEYRTVAGRCACGRRHHSDFPATAVAPVQYGASVSALAVYLTQYQLLPYHRTAELLAQVGGIALSVVGRLRPAGAVRWHPGARPLVGLRALRLPARLLQRPPPA